MMWMIDSFFFSFSAILLYLVILIVEFWQNLSDKHNIYYSYLLLRVTSLIYLIVPILFLVVSSISRKEISIGGSDFKTAYVIKTTYRILNTHYTLFYIFFLIWFLMFLLLFSITFIKKQFYIKKLIQVSNLYKETEGLLIKKKIEKMLGIKKTIKVYKSEANLLDSAFITGMFNPIIFLPDNLDKQMLLFILEHELMHYKKKDLVFKNIVAFIQCFYWFNPFLFLFSQRFDEDCEIACDQSLMKTKPHVVRKEYTHTILKFINKKNKSLQSFPNFFTNYKRIERRLTFIMKQNKITKVSITCFLCIIFMSMLPLVAYATSFSKTLLFEQVDKINSYEYSSMEVKEFVEQTEKVSLNYTTTRKEEMQLNAKGVNAIDCEISKENLIIDTLDLSKNSKIQVMLAGDNKSDMFQVGIIRNGIKKYVKSSEGNVIHTFTIEETGSYEIFIESSATVHITGAITIK